MSVFDIKGKVKATTGYGLALLAVFIASTILIGASMQMLAGPVTLSFVGTSSQTHLAAQQLAEGGMDIVAADIQNLYATGQSVTTGYTYSSASSPGSVLMPQSPDTLAGATDSIGSYTGGILWVTSGSCLARVTATVGGSTVILTRVVPLLQGTRPLDSVTGATAAYGLRKLRTAYAGSAIRVRRGSDNTEQDIGFDATGNLDMAALRTFLNGGVTTYPKPLDSVGSAATAYSLRKLRAAYTGSAIRVRRSSDNTEQDIGFDANGDLDVRALLLFVGTGSGYVRTWYDQSTNGTNATQATSANQPRIVNAGALEMVKGRPAIRFDASDDYMTFSRTIGDDFSILFVFSPISGSNPVSNPQWHSHAGLVDMEVGGVANDFGTSLGSTGEVYAGVGNPDSSIRSWGLNLNDGQQHRFTMTRQRAAGTFQLYVDNVSHAYSGVSTATLNAGASIAIGSTQTLFHYYGGQISEVITYASSLSTANRQTLENDQVLYYQTSTTPITPVRPLDSGASAAAAYGLRKLRTAYGGSAIQVRRSSDNMLKDIGFDRIGDLDVASLMAFCGTDSCYVRTWYDQSVTGNNAVQTTDSAQPRIVNAGVLDMQNGRPAVYFNGAANNEMTYTLLTPTDVLMVSGLAAGTVYPQLGYGGGSAARIALTSTLAAYRGPTSVVSTNATTLAAGLHQLSVDATAAYAISMWTDGVAGTPASGTDTGLVSVKNFGNYNNGSYYTGYLAEVIMFTTTNISAANRQTLESNQIAYHNVNSAAPGTGFVTKWYDQSVNGYDFSQSAPPAQPRIQIDQKTNRPIVVYNGISSFMTTARTLNITSNQATAFAVGNAYQTTWYGRLFSGKSDANYDYDSTTSGIFMYATALNNLSGSRNNGDKGVKAFTLNKPFQATSIYDGTNHTMRINGIAGTSVASSGNFGITQLWNGLSPILVPDDYWNGSISEMILYASNLSSTNIQNIEQNQRSYHGIE